MLKDKNKYDSKPSEENIAKVLRELKEENSKLKLEITQYKEILRENGLEDSPSMSDAETICVNEICRLKELSEGPGLTFEDTKILDILHKNLLMARGKETKPAKKDKKLSTAELLSIVDGSKK